MSDLNIQNVFGKYAVEVEDGEVKLFNTHAEAIAVATEFLKGAEFREEAAAYCAYKGLEGKNAKGKENVLVDYLGWVEAGRPEAMPEEEVEAEKEEEANSVATPVEGETASEF